MTAPLVLVAEDDPGVRMSLELALDVEGFEVVTAPDGEQALALATSRLPDVILLDHFMPKLAGKDVLSALRSQANTRHIPVFVLTGMEPALDEGWQGAHFVGKPFVPHELIEKIRGVLQER